MKLLSLFASITALTMVLLAIPAAAEKRVALVIGNSDYKVAGGNWSDLRNPANDARDFAAALKKTGFTLIGGDVVLVDLARRSPTPPGIFILYDGMGLVAKRLEHVPNNDPPKVRVISDNTFYSPYERTADEIHIIGRVRWFAREL